MEWVIVEIPVVNVFADVKVTGPFASEHEARVYATGEGLAHWHAIKVTAPVK